MPFGQVMDDTLLIFLYIPTIKNARSLFVTLPMVGIMEWALFWDNERNSVKY